METTNYLPIIFSSQWRQTSLRLMSVLRTQR